MPLLKITDNALHVNAVLAINKPAAVRFKKYTYIAFYDSAYTITAVKFNNETLKIEQVKAVASNPIGSDEHAAPAIIVDGAGYIHIFYGSHSSTQYYAKSTRPEDISEFNIRTMAISTPTYPQLALGYINNVETIWLGYRSIATTPASYRIVKTQDGGNTWSTEKSIIYFGSPYPIYPWGLYSDMKKPTSTLHLLWHYYNESTYVRDNVYYAKSLDGGDTWRKADGTVTPLPISKDAADLVIDTTGLAKYPYGSGLYYTAQPCDIGLDEDGEAYVLFNVPDGRKAYVAYYDNGWKYTLVKSGLAYTFCTNCLGRVSKSLIEVFVVDSDSKVKKYVSKDGCRSFQFESVIGDAYYNPSEYENVGVSRLMGALDLTPAEGGFKPLCIWAGSPLYLYGEEVAGQPSLIVPSEFISYAICVAGGILSLNLVWQWILRRVREAKGKWKS